VNGDKEKDRGMVIFAFKIKVFIKGHFCLIIVMDLGLNIILMAIVTKDNMLKEDSMEKEFIYGPLELVSKVNFLKDVKMGKEYGALKLVNNIKDNIFMIKNMDRVDTNGQMDASMKGNLSMTNSNFQQ